MGYADYPSEDHALLQLAGVSYYDFINLLSVHRSNTGRIVVVARAPLGGSDAYQGSVKPFRERQDGNGHTVFYFDPIE